MSPLKTEFVKLTKTNLSKNRLLIGIDSGSSLTKILFLNKCHKEEFLNDDIPTFTLEFSLFQKRDFESALQYLKTNAFQLWENDESIHITGVHALSNRDTIKFILNRDVIFIDELDTITNGHRIGLELIGIENMLVEKIDVKGFGEIENEIVERMKKNMRSKFKDEEDNIDSSSPYPCLFSLHGSWSEFLYFDSKGIPELLSISTFGGKTLFGLAKSLLDTNDYNEVVDLASRGDRSNVDTIIKELLDETIDSPYGKFPRYLPVFSFGKCADYNIGLSDLRKEDIAQALISFYGRYILLSCLTICPLKSMAKVYLNGNLFVSEMFQIEINKLTSIHPTINDHLFFVNFGYFGALGAMFCDTSIANLS